MLGRLPILYDSILYRLHNAISFLRATEPNGQLSRYIGQIRQIVSPDLSKIGGGISGEITESATGRSIASRLV
ncbi:pyrroline-5-carboxylate reductase [Paenibacillus popilliae ATCC 14706]|uniref:Pyrroline-5-carboxylate reductase n=1 Tax=Paenibacillus popilliae ATCC 14706 TaxID=1212764 RepID=M9LR09_PAEPP|nr:pyrroline-5-carboxylate reductase [Paenibacillus popilliae ATCC 14706]